MSGGIRVPKPCQVRVIPPPFLKERSMAELVIPDLEEAVLDQRAERAARHGRTPAQEAKVILAEAVSCQPLDAWRSVDELYQRLAASGRTFSDSADLLREDRDR